MWLYRRALAYFKPDWKLVLVWLGMIGLSTGLGLLAVWPMAILIDSVFGNQFSKDWIHHLFLAPLPSSALGRILGLALIGLFLKICQELLNMGQSLVSTRITYNGLLRVRCDLYRKLQALCISYHRASPQGDAIYRLSNDTLGCQTILTVLVNTAVAAGTLIAMTIVLATRSLSLTALAFSIVPILAAANFIFGRRFCKHTLACKDQDARFTTVMQRSMSCISLMQLFGREADEFNRFETAASDSLRAWWKLNWQQVTYNLIVGATFGLGAALIFGYGGYLVYRDQYMHPGHGGMTVGDLVVFTSYLGMFWTPLCSMTGFFYNMQGGVASVQRVFEVLDRSLGISDQPASRPIERRPSVLELDDVSFDYDYITPVLRNVSARIEAGQMVAFVGSSGAGKSTLLNLLPRFYDPSSGAVRFDGVDVRQLKLSDVRRNVALALQESVILPTTIAENIAYGRPKASIQEVRNAAEMAGAAGFIEKLPKGYETLITEGGQNLSGGQRQRISIARALLTDAPFIVLDEPTSALDPLHERRIIETLRQIKGRRTIIIVSHRLSTVVDCDQIYVLDRGSIVEHGSHRELLDHGGLYWRMTGNQVAEPQAA